MIKSSPKALRLAAVMLGVGVLMSTPAARAGDDDDELTFEEKIIDNLMKGLGATNMAHSGIDYRERSPLVVPPKLDLPPPASAATEKAVPNWPQDPDEKRRKAAIAARKKEKANRKDATQAAIDDARPLKPSELNVARTRPDPEGARNADSLKPGDPNAAPLSPSQLGYQGGLLGMFKMGNQTESAEFKAEPPRSSLVQPPPGYQTPSSNYMYGTGPKESLNKPVNPMSQKPQE
jgi:hypothetical protein